MKREEKNQLTRRKIMDSALAEFSEKGYGASSINTVCAGQGISKGIIYHYFETKNDLFLACVEECFQRLTEYLRQNLKEAEYEKAKYTLSGETQIMSGFIQLEDGLEHYFTARQAFFQENPVYRRIFCEAVVNPPIHLQKEIQERKEEFDSLNIQILDDLLKPVHLRGGITRKEVVDMFRQFQDFVNVNYRMPENGTEEFEQRELSCRKAMNILLYGVIKRSDMNYD